MPSLHMAYPTYLAFYIIYIWRRWGWISLLLPIAIGFSTIILGHHYVIDLIFGVLYAAVVFAGTIGLKHYIDKRHSKV
jgi:membrane-associated phospholipid phosphatase